MIINLLARKAARHRGEIASRLQAAGLELDEVHEVGDPAVLPGHVAAAIERGCKRIIVGGGDGTISSVAGCFAYRHAAMGILPLGTANDFARTLGMPLDLEECVKVLAASAVSRVDLGLIGERYFTTGASIGVPAAVAKSNPLRLKRWLGRLAYLAIATGAFARHHPFRCCLSTNGVTQCYSAIGVRIASGGYQGGIQVVENARVDDGRVVVRIRKGTKWSLASDWAQTVLGIRPPWSAAETVAASELYLETVPPQDLSIDGEPGARTPVRIAVARGALLVIRPTPGQDLASSPSISST